MILPRTIFSNRFILSFIGFFFFFFILFCYYYLFLISSARFFHSRFPSPLSSSQARLASRRRRDNEMREGFVRKKLRGKQILPSFSMNLIMMIWTIVVLVRIDINKDDIISRPYLHISMISYLFQQLRLLVLRSKTYFRSTVIFCIRYVCQLEIFFLRKCSKTWYLVNAEVEIFFYGRDKK